MELFDTHFVYFGQVLAVSVLKMLVTDAYKWCKILFSGHLSQNENKHQIVNVRYIGHLSPTISSPTPIICFHFGMRAPKRDLSKHHLMIELFQSYYRWSCNNFSNYCIALVWREQPSCQVVAYMYSLFCCRNLRTNLKRTGTSLANRVGLINTGAWLSQCARAQHCTRHFVFSHFDHR